MSFSIGNEPVLFRPFEKGDVNYIMSTWLRSERDISRMTEKRFFAWRRPAVELHVEHDDFIVACDPNKPSAIYGWACFRQGVPIYVYVMAALRNNGLRAELLLQSKAIT